MSVVLAISAVASPHSLVDDVDALDSFRRKVDWVGAVFGRVEGKGQLGELGVNPLRVGVKPEAPRSRSICVAGCRGDDCGRACGVSL